MKPCLLTLAVLLLLSKGMPGSTEKCWNLHGSCRDKCVKKEKVYVFCTSGKLCCVKLKFQPDLSPKNKDNPKKHQEQQKIPNI
ncbi:PREDICTED: beta-defensin 36-like [Ceratotherium simum simum]|uniref:Beta-defensin n=1 Tax=Ceratotherium simum simum TaxID=73337 RepID=A0ABM0I8E9_CERSS|nr:PREDICTED: beta-defensin 36-like [Ceratotherium simum simum]